MRIPLLSLLAAVAAATAADSITTTVVTFGIPASPQLPNPGALSASTHATLSSLGASLSAPLSRSNTFVFRNVTPGSYLVDVHCGTHAFAPARLDVVVVGAAGQQQQQQQQQKQKLLVKAWETYRGNDWDNKGEALPWDKEAGSFNVRALGEKNYFMERSQFNVLSLLKNPMILIGLVSMGLFIGMPKLMENMDPEMRAEFEEQQKKGPMAALLGGAAGGGAGGAGSGGARSAAESFDMASFLAGAGKKSSSDESGGGGGGNSKGGVRR